MRQGASRPELESSSAVVEPLEARRLLHGGIDLAVSFQPGGMPAPEGFVADSGRAFSYRADSGHRYGWTMAGGAWHNSWSGRRNTPGDDATDSFIAMGYRGGLAWEVAVPNGLYRVTLAAGDSVFRAGESHRLALEAEVALEHTATAQNPGATTTVEVEVTDGRLTITAPDGVANSKLAWIEIHSIEEGDHGGGDGGGDGGGGDGGGGDGGGGDGGGGDGGGGGGTISLDTWQSITNMPHPVMEGGSVELNGTIYVWGGYDTPGVWRSRTRGQAYDTSTGTWRTVADLPQALTHFQAVPYEGRIYIFGGYINTDAAGGPLDDVWVYDPPTNSFSHVADMPFAISGQGVALVDSRAYVVSGMFRQGRNFHSGSSNMFSIDLADPGAGWRTEPDTPVARDHMDAVTIDGLIYMVSGQENDDQYNGVRPHLYQYNPSEQTWTRMADMPDGGRGHIDQSTIIYNGRILVLGGNANDSPGQNYRTQVYMYDPGTDHWSLLGNIPLPRVGGNAAVVGDRLYFMGGGDGAPRSNAWSAQLITS